MLSRSTASMQRRSARQSYIVGPRQDAATPELKKLNGLALAGGATADSHLTANSAPSDHDAGHANREPSEAENPHHDVPGRAMRKEPTKVEAMQRVEQPAVDPIALPQPAHQPPGRGGRHVPRSDSPSARPCNTSSGVILIRDRSIGSRRLNRSAGVYSGKPTYIITRPVANHLANSRLVATPSHRWPTISHALPCADAAPR